MQEPRATKSNMLWPRPIANTNAALAASLSCALPAKGAAEILQILRKRLHNDPQAELEESAEQQRQITQIRLKRWLQE